MCKSLSTTIRWMLKQVQVHLICHMWKKSKKTFFTKTHSSFQPDKLDIIFFCYVKILQFYLMIDSKVKDLRWGTDEHNKQARLSTLSTSFCEGFFHDTEECVLRRLRKKKIFDTCTWVGVVVKVGQFVTGQFHMSRSSRCELIAQ